MENPKKCKHFRSYFNFMKMVLFHKWQNVVYLLTSKINTKTQVETSLVTLTGSNTVADGYYEVWGIWCSKIETFI